MGGGSDAPPPPDYSSIAQAQTAGNLQQMRAQTAANRPNQVGPLGSVTWYNEPGTDQWTQDTQLDPALQSSLSSQLNVQQYLSNLGDQYKGNVGAAYSQPYQLPAQLEGYQQAVGAAPTAGAMPDTSFGAVQDIQNAMMSRLNPDLERRRQAAEAAAAAKGITAGSDAYRTVEDQLSRNETDASMQALLGAMSSYRDITGQQMASQAQQYGQGMMTHQQAAADYAARMAERNQQIQEQSYMRNLPLNELNAILRGQGVSMPQFQGFSQQGGVQGPDLLNAAESGYQAQLAQANADAQQSSGLGGAIGGIAGGLIGTMVAPGVGTMAGYGIGSGIGRSISDVRVKDILGKISTDKRGFGWYVYRFKGSKALQIGVIAQEVRKVLPDAVEKINGLWHVDYGRL